MQAGTCEQLYIVKEVSFGVYLGEHFPDESQEEVLLPAKEVPPGSKKGDRIRVFLYFDSSDRLIATRRSPYVTLHETARLTVRECTAVGAFLDWGLEKDLLLPFAEQTKKVREGESVLCALYADKSGRLAATMNVYPYLKQDAPYGKDDTVSGTAYEKSDRFGLFVAVDDLYSALIPKKELTRQIAIGERVTARVAQVLADGRLTLSLRKKAYLQMEDDADMLLDILKKNGGALRLGDRSAAEDIREALQMSKAQFKRASGRLYKNGLATVSDQEIRLVTSGQNDQTKKP